MDIKVQLNEEIIKNAIDESLEKSVKESMCGYSVVNAISKSIANEALDGVISQSIISAVQNVDKEYIINKLVDEITASVIKVTKRILQEGLVDAICKLRGIGDYLDSDKKLREELRKEIFESVNNE